ncbi:unnamed protein product [Heligmosomoides polygyrus]|uniref:Importin-7 n=1 Tax=Heligmosomoides polygyrus TaxID=6339 RepID=A0A183GVU2_HELPZ|nr:unnamed protein product [Heligmosomoides polygyrus]
MWKPFCTCEELFYAYLVPGHPKPLDYLCDELLSVYVDISGVHNRKMALLCICDFLNLPETERPAIVSHNLRKIIEVCIFIFGGLQRVMKIQSDMRTKDLDTDMWSESDDHMDSFSDDDEEDAGYIDESVTEKFETFLDKEDALDIFVYFRETIDELKHFEPELFASAVSSLNHRKLKSLQTLIKRLLWSIGGLRPDECKGLFMLRDESDSSPCKTCKSIKTKRPPPKSVHTRAQSLSLSSLLLPV